ncbi:MAG: ABC transporter permease [Coprococcus sp.]|nr:ABC transporter permease [Coprococcus sp.]
MKKLMKNNFFILILVLIIVMAVMSGMSDYFLTADYLLNATRFISETSMIGLGMTLVILTGGIDLSVGSMMALSSICLGLTCQAGVPAALAVLISLAVGAAGGALNGYAVCKMNLPALIVTLATMGLFRGIALGISGGSAIPVPDALYFLGQGNVGPLPMQLVITTGAYMIVAVFIYKSNFGVYLKGIGYNEEVAVFSGIKVTWNKVKAYMLSGFFAALLGILFTCRVSSAKADYGNNYEMDAITIAVFGGASLAGGKVSFAGSYIAAIIIVLIRLGLTTAAIQTEIQSVIIGMILILAVAFNNFVASRKEIEI